MGVFFGDKAFALPRIGLNYTINDCIIKQNTIKFCLLNGQKWPLHYHRSFTSPVTPIRSILCPCAKWLRIPLYSAY